VVTGSVNQKGEMQAIRGVNQKIEGFCDYCREIGLTGHQGVTILQSNRMFALNVTKSVISSMLLATFRSAVVQAILIAGCKKDITSSFNKALRSFGSSLTIGRFSLLATRSQVPAPNAKY